MSGIAHPVTHLAQHALVVHTPGRGLVEVGADLAAFVVRSGIAIGILHVWCHHTSCSLLASENADPVVQADLERFFARLVPDGDPLFRHDAEGPDDMPAHVRSALTATSLSIPIHGGKLALGTWQGVYLYEHRTRPHQRRLTATALGL